MSSLPKNRFGVLAAVVLAVFFVLTIATAVTKEPWCDEGWFASPARNLAFGVPVIAPVEETRLRPAGKDPA